MKKVGLTQRVEVVPAYGERRDCLDQDWIRLVESMGLMPILLPNVIADVDSYIKSLDLSGVILTGGNDLAIISTAANVAPERDSFERNLICACSRFNIPLLGVCRGMQMLASYYGSKLSQVKQHVASRHFISFDTAQAILHVEKMKVNSFHKYGIKQDDLGSNLIPLAWSDDGYVEMIKHKNLYQYGVMWHPEREKPFNDIDRSLIMNILHQTNCLNKIGWS